ncbi:MAG: hypothetical protein CSA65_02400 [Proteobacteria bacterium]|nr:MAG: hypothetical protein CSA65_02400 [Pseudomonadota bacterium]
MPTSETDRQPERPVDIDATGELTRLRQLWERPLVRWSLYALAYVVAYLALHPRLWDGKHFLGWDVLDYAWPNIEYLKNAIVGGELPLWCPYEKAGFSFFSDPETGVLYPVHWLMATLEGIFGAGVWVMLVQVLVHVLIAALGMHYYLRRQHLVPQACWIGSLAYVLSSRLAKSKDQTALGTVAWFPWMLIAIEETVKRPSWRPAAVLGLVIGVDLLAGYPPNFFRNIVGLTLVFGYEVGVVLMQTRERKAYLWRLSKAMLVGGLIAFALSAPVLFALASISETARAGMSIVEVLRSSLRPSDALQLVAPGIRGKSAFLFYLGFAPAALALLALTRYSGRRVLWAAGAALFFLLACAGNTPILPLLMRLFPPFGLFRVSEQYLFVAAFFMALLAARGLTDLLSATDEERAALKLKLLLVSGAAFLVGLASTVIAVLNKAPSVMLIQAAGTSLVVIVGSTIVLSGLLSRKPRSRVIAAWLLIPVLLLDLSLQNRTIYDITKTKPDMRNDGKLSALKAPDKDVRKDVRIADEGHFGYRVSMRHEVRDIFGRQTALISERYRRYMLAAKHNYKLLAAANVRYYAGRWLMTLKRQAGSRVRMIKPGVIEFLDHAPLAYWVGAPKLVKAGPQALAAMRSGEPGTVGVVEKKDLTKFERERVAAMRSQAQPVKARLLRYQRNALKLAVDVPAAGLVVINEKHARGWRAQVDGKPVRILRANYLFRGVLVPAGLHEIKLTYRPTKVLAGMALFAVASLSLCGLFVWGLIRRRREKRRIEG